MPKAGPVPDREELTSLAHAALVHARALGADADLLLEHRRWPTAYAVGALAFEELGKSWICLVGVGAPDAVRVGNWFWPMFNDHRAKLTCARYLFTLMTGAGTASQPVIEAIEELSALASADHDTKMRGLYVDYDNGSLLNPADVTEPEAARMVTNLHACLDALASLTDIEQMSEFALTMTQLSQVFTQMSSGDDAIQLLQGVWDAAHAVGPPKPPWGLFPDVFPAPESTA